MSEKPSVEPREGEGRSLRQSALTMAMVVAGIVVGQFILIGPSLVGTKVLLPLDILMQRGHYIPCLADKAPPPPHDRVLSDLVLMGCPNEQFMVSEIRAGRWPLWTPNQFCGSPFVTGYKYSPFSIFACLTSSPIAVAWTSLFLAVSTGLGAYFFCRCALRVGPWPATIAAWCWPLTGFFIFWMGYSLPLSMSWLPWVLWMVDGAVRRSNRWAGIGLALATYLAVVCGQFDVGAQVLLISGLYAVWCFLDQYRLRCLTPQVLPALATVVAGWGLGLALAAIYFLPMLEYSQASSRLERRRSGEEERPPIGLEALPQIVLPDRYGSTQLGSFWVPPRDAKGNYLEGNLLESPSAAYAGLLATLLLMPLAWCSRRHLSVNIFLTALGVLGVSWALDLPIVVQLLRMPGLNMLSHNRFVFATSFAVLAMMAIGLDVLWRGDVRWRWWFWGPVGLLIITLLWCGYSSVVLPPEITKELIALDRAVLSDDRAPNIMLQSLGITTAADVASIRSKFVLSFSVAAMLCIAAIGGWALIGLRMTSRRWFLPAVCTLLLADLLWFAYGRPAQCDPALNFPRIPALEQVAKAEPGRIVGYGCLPAVLGQSHNLRDIRGYDAVDPSRMVELLLLASEPGFRSPQYAATQWLLPKVKPVSPTEIQMHPIMDMLGVRYVIFRGTPQKGMHADFSSLDYWVMKNRYAMPRVFVPQRVETATDKEERLAKLADTSFHPRDVAYVEEPVELPAECRGVAEIVEEIPTRIKVSLDMQTPGLVVLADRWDAGWHAYYDGKQVPILQTNHALRGVVAPKGKGTLEFRYEPTGFAWGLRLAGLAMLAMMGWAGAIVWKSRSAAGRVAEPLPPSASPAATPSSSARKGPK